MTTTSNDDLSFDRTALPVVGGAECSPGPPAGEPLNPDGCPSRQRAPSDSLDALKIRCADCGRTKKKAKDLHAISGWCCYGSSGCSVCGVVDPLFPPLDDEGHRCEDCRLIGENGSEGLPD